jgi:hypothetical protein
MEQGAKRDALQLTQCAEAPEYGVADFAPRIDDYTVTLTGESEWVQAR